MSLLFLFSSIPLIVRCVILLSMDDRLIDGEDSNEFILTGVLVWGSAIQLWWNDLDVTVTRQIALLHYVAFDATRAVMTSYVL